MTLSRAEQVALTAASVLVFGVILPYLADYVGAGVQPLWSAAGAFALALLVSLGLRRHVRPGLGELFLFAAITTGTTAYLCWIAWPSLLPPGSGPDLTHHLVLIEYIEQHGTLVHEADAGGLLGEMADYTPGLHLLAVLAGAISRTNGFTATYLVLAFAVGLKVGIFFLLLLRVLSDSPHRRAIAAAGAALVIYVSTYSVHSFTRDSYFAQVASETFALTMWWAFVTWWHQPTGGAATVFAAGGAAAFLTWPLWIGPPVTALAAGIALRRNVAWRTKANHLTLALTPIVVVTLLHTLGRTSAVGIVGTSGAVAAPSLSQLGWWLPLLATIGLAVAAANRRYWPLGLFAAAIAAQSAALWGVARYRGAGNPYMAIKMTYLAVYPAIAAVALCAATVVRVRLAAWAVAGMVTVLAVESASRERLLSPIVSQDLWRTGHWARQRIVPECVDYLVGNAETAYWLHLAIMGNRRASHRTVNDDTFATQRAFERWLTDAGPDYAVAHLPVLPAEILDRVRILHTDGAAAVVQRLTTTTALADGGCAVSQPTTRF